MATVTDTAARERWEQENAAARVREQDFQPIFPAIGQDSGADLARAGHGEVCRIATVRSAAQKALHAKKGGLAALFPL